MFDIISYRKLFSKQDIEIRILIPIIPQNMLKVKLYAKKSTLNMTEFTSLKKINPNIIIVKRNIQFWDVWLVRIYIGAFFKLFITLPLDITTGNWWKRKFLKVSQVFHNKLSAFLWHFGTPFSNGKNERNKWQGTWSMLQWPSPVAIRWVS